ncbi:phage terminase large subunit family protein [Pseudomonas sp. CCC3.2]|uniref:phage terminase large subunit family protein n=1 Tax=unclassified Pseudomonas TaxID=196821 RepID=UPI002AB36DC2|nr:MULTISPECIES: phage terminase large subunit family protein [unclassified Pseudomonas]MDY7560207.1 phage terminase large subunit family protein [Pseudomonas sp. AB6]MEB0178756.1 phage terminase large subunit family protein [Pseudomonas sp. CCC3.2]MEB0211394.1 phage terminase large subunit family protein [Pseudomonas sp. AB6]
MGSAPEGRRYAEGYTALQAGLFDARRRNIQPPPKLSLSQWADRHAMLSPETSAQTGRFHAFPYQNGIMDAITDPTVEMVSVQKSARVGYTKIMDHVAGFHIHQDPAPILVVQPRVEDAEDYSVTEIEPMLRDTPVLAEITGDLKRKDSRQKIAKRIFRNGASISFVGANSPGGFRRITARVVLFDEVDGYPIMGAGKEGDQIKLGIKRTESFWNRKIILGSTPTVKGESRIEKSYANSDQRRYYVPCPHCGEYQVLEWGGPDTPYGMKWDKDENGIGIPESVFYVCRATACMIFETDKEEMIGRGEWRAAKPFKGHAGFHIWAAYSLFVNAAWRNLVAEWLEVKDDPLMRQTFVNLVLGETYEDRGDRALQESKLTERCEVWGSEVPDGVAVITVGVDTQDDRFECEVVGWGTNEESWSIDFEVIHGDMETPDIWNRLDAYLKRIWYRADGRGFEIMAVCHDSGGHHSQKVYDFSKARIGRRIWAIRGESAVGGKRSPVWPTKTPSRRNKSAFRPVIIGVNAAKDSVRSRLHQVEHGPGYMHFPTERDINYFAQLTSERSVRKTSGGQTYRVWELPPGRANEALDCRVYAYAALCGLLHAGLKLNKRAEEVNASIGIPVFRPPLTDEVDAQPVAAQKPEKTGPSITQPDAPVRNKPKRRLA